MTITISFRLILLLVTSAHSNMQRNYLAIKESPSNSSLPIAADTSNFKELVQKSNVFVDKTTILIKILKMAHKVSLLSLPSAWGKSLTLDMIKTFVELQLDVNGDEILPLEGTENYRLFKNGEIVLPGGRIERLKSRLEVSNAYSIMKLYQGKFPVICITLDGTNGSSYEETLYSLGTKISEEFSRHNYLKKWLLDVRVNQNVTEEEKTKANADLELFQKIVDCKLDANELTTSLVFLSELLHKRFNRPVFLLMDDWDAVFTNIIIQSNITVAGAHRIIAVFSSFMINTFISNTHLEKGIAIGTFRALKLLPNLQPIKEFKTTTNPFYHLCSFTNEEVDALFDHLQLNITEDQRYRIDDWYNGYKKVSIDKLRSYTPRSLANFVNTGKIDNYRKSRNSNARNILQGVFKNDDVRNTFENSLMIGEHERFFYKVLTHTYLLHYQKVSRAINNDMVTPFRHHLHSYLYDAGYLKIILRGYNDIHAELMNEEVRNELITIIMEFYTRKYHFCAASLENAVDHLAEFVANDRVTCEPLADTLQTLVNTSETHMIHFITQFISSQIVMKYDYRSEKPENNVHDWSLKGNTILYNKKQGVIIASIIQSIGKEDVLEHAKKLREPLNKFKTLQRIKYIGISISPDNRIHVHAEIQEIQL